MIELTRLNSQRLVVNSDQIKFVEQAHDTVLSLINGEKVLVRESASEVIRLVIEFRRAILQGISIGGSLPAVVVAQQGSENEE